MLIYILKTVPYFQSFRNEHIGFLYWLVGLMNYYSGDIINCIRFELNYNLHYYDSTYYELYEDDALVKQMKLYKCWFINGERGRYIIPYIDSSEKYILCCYTNPYRIVLLKKSKMYTSLFHIDLSRFDIYDTFIDVCCYDRTMNHIVMWRKIK